MTPEILEFTAKKARELTNEFYERHRDIITILNDVQEASRRGFKSLTVEGLTPEQVKALEQRGFKINTKMARGLTSEVGTVDVEIDWSEDAEVS